MKGVDKAVYGIFFLALIGCAYKAADHSGRIFVTSKQSCADLLDSGFCSSGGTKCEVWVEVSRCDQNVEPKVIPAVLSVCKMNTQITWHLYGTDAASGAKFAAANGVDFKGSPEFAASSVSRSGKTYEWTDRYTKGEAASAVPYHYGLHIQKADGTACYYKDPVVVNE
jgi:hypothetical protein